MKYLIIFKDWDIDLSIVSDDFMDEDIVNLKKYYILYIKVVYSDMTINWEVV